MVNRPGFRRSGSGSAPGESGRESVLGETPFSQQQILHLMKSEFARARRHGMPLACIMVQVDRLANLGEVHGVALRDAILKALGRLLTDVTREHDHIGTSTEDRFLMVLPHTDGDAAMAVAERIRERFQQLEIQGRDAVVPVSISLGVVTGQDQETMFFDTMIAQAEVALEWAGQDGGNQAVLFDRQRYLGPDA